MIRINLMPYRHRRLTLRRRRFVSGLGVTILVACVLVVAASFVLERLQAQQKARNAVLEKAKATLTQQEGRVRALQREVSQLEQRQSTAAALQEQRNLPVGLLNELSRLTPPGLVLTAVRQNDQRLALTGVAVSNERVSDFMAQLQTESTILHGPELVEMRSVAPTRPNRAPSVGAAPSADPETVAERTVDFTMNLQLKRDALQTEGRP